MQKAVSYQVLAWELEGVLESERQRHEDAVEALKAQHASELRQVRVQADADADRKHLMLQTDELRQAHRAQAEQLREQLDGARAMVDASRLQINAAREAGSRWQGRAQALQEALGEARQQVAWLSERAGEQKRASVKPFVKITRRLKPYMGQ